MLGVATVTVAALAGHAIAHNGLSPQPQFSEPTGLVVLDGTESLMFRWATDDIHPDLVYRLYLQSGDLPPTTSPDASLVDGVELAEVEALEKDVAYELDPSGLETGAYRLPMIYEDPPCRRTSLAPALVVVRRDGDPPPLGVVVTEPFDASIAADGETPISLDAIGTGPLTVTIEAGDLVDKPNRAPNTLCLEFVYSATFTAFEDLVMEPDDASGPDRHRLSLMWDVSDVPSGPYLLRATVTDASGAQAVTYARRWINVQGETSGPGEGPVELGPEPIEQINPESDGGDTGDEGDNDGCSAATGASQAFMALLALLWLARRQTSRRCATHD